MANADQDTTGSALGRSFQFGCLRCGSILEAKTGQAGSSGRCPSCAAVFNIPLVDNETGLPLADADPGEDGELPAPVHAYAAAGTKAPRLVRRPDDSLHVECPRCGRQSEVSEDCCPGCGLPFTMEGMGTSAPTAGRSQGTGCMLLGITAIVLGLIPGIGILPGLVAIAVGASARSRSSTRAAGTIGIALGVAACAVSLLMLVVVMN